MLTCALAICGKDLRLILARGAGLLQALLLGLLLVFLFSLSLNAGDRLSPQAAAAMFWLASAFCQVLIFNMLYAVEESAQARLGLVLLPAPVQAVWLGKAMAGFLLLSAAQCVFIPAVFVFLGQHLGQGWHWALAGIVLGNEFRIKQESFEAEVNLNYMPHDRKLGEDRYSIQGKFSGHWNGFNYGVNYNQVSDDDFLDDFASSIRDNSEDILPQDYWLTYGTTYWTAALRVTKNQTINDTDKPYEREPQFTWGAYFADLYGFELNTKIDATRFVHPWENRTNGNRFVFEQDVSYPLLGAGWFVTPKVKLVGLSYDLDEGWRGSDNKTPSLTLPMYSLDSGLIFERNTSVGSRDILQTLEPRIYYSYTPYRDQSDIPVFDSTEADFNFAQLYSENVWSGYDRYAETNQVSGTITTRLIDDKTGLEWIRASIGQRYYFNDLTVNYWGDRIDQTSKSDFLASIGARLTRTLQATAYGQWSWERSSMQKATVGFRWQPRPMSVVGLYYRYNWSDVENSRGYIDDYINQIDLSVQWPLTNRLYALARQNYSFYDNKFIESLVGFEYQADCWVLRAVAQRYTRDEEEEQTSFFLQLELTGLGAVGSSPLSELQRSIQGYQQTTPMPTTAGTYDYYY